MSSYAQDQAGVVPFFNSSKLVCGLRQVVIEAVNPAHHPVFGFVTAFDTSGRVSVDKVEDSPSRRTYSAGRALRSIDLFLRVFPHGKVILHLPVDSLPPDGGPPPRCVCPGERVACKQRGTAWPDRRLRLMRELTRTMSYNESEPYSRVPVEISAT